MQVCIGGTFTILHRGHEQLFKTAFEHAGPNGHVYIGVTSGKIADKEGAVRSFEQRKQALKRFLSEHYPTSDFEIIPITTKFGITLEEDFDVIIVSPETRQVAEEINSLRVEQGKQQMEIIEVPYVLAADGKPISSTRIRNGEIDCDGRILTSD